MRRDRKEQISMEEHTISINTLWTTREVRTVCDLVFGSEAAE